MAEPGSAPNCAFVNRRAGRTISFGRGSLDIGLARPRAVALPTDRLTMTSWLSSAAEGLPPRSEMAPSGLVMLHAVSDGVIALSLLTIPAALIYINKRRGQEQSGRVRRSSLCSRLFIFAVGLAHLAAPSPAASGRRQQRAGGSVEGCRGAARADHRHRHLEASAAAVAASLARPAASRSRRAFAHLRGAESRAASARGARRGAHQGIGRGQAALRDRAARLADLRVQPRQGHALHLGAQRAGRPFAGDAARQDRRRGAARRGRQNDHGGQAQGDGHRRSRKSSRPISSCSGASVPSIS